MKTEEKNSSPKVRIAVLGNMNVGKSGELIHSCVEIFSHKNLIICCFELF